MCLPTKILYTHISHTHIFAAPQVLTHVYTHTHSHIHTHVHMHTNPAHTHAPTVAHICTNTDAQVLRHTATSTASRLHAQLHTLTDTVTHWDVCRVTSTAAHPDTHSHALGCMQGHKHSCTHAKELPHSHTPTVLQAPGPACHSFQKLCCTHPGRRPRQRGTVNPLW